METVFSAKHPKKFYAASGLRIDTGNYYEGAINMNSFKNFTAQETAVAILDLGCWPTILFPAESLHYCARAEWQSPYWKELGAHSIDARSYRAALQRIPECRSRHLLGTKPRSRLTLAH